MICILLLSIILSSLLSSDILFRDRFVVIDAEDRLLRIAGMDPWTDPTLRGIPTLEGIKYIPP